MMLFMPTAITLSMAPSRTLLSRTVVLIGTLYVFYLKIQVTSDTVLTITSRPDCLRRDVRLDPRHRGPVVHEAPITPHLSLYHRSNHHGGSNCLLHHGC